MLVVIDLDWLPSVLLTAVGFVLTPVAALLRLLHTLLPDPVASAISQLESGGDFLVGLTWLNWFLPLPFMVATFTAFVTIMVVYYGYTLTIRLGLRFVQK